MVKEGTLEDLEFSYSLEQTNKEFDKLKNN